MLSLFHSLARSSRIMSTLASRNQRTLMSSRESPPQLLDAEKATPANHEARMTLSERIYAASTKTRFENLVEQNLRAMSNRNIFDCMKQYARLARSDPTISAMDDPIFKSLSGHLLIALRHCDLNECFHLARAAGSLKLPCTSSLVQGIYQMVRTRLNEFDIRQITGLHVFVNQLTGTSTLTETIKVSLPLVFQANVEKQLDPSDMQLCLNALKFVISTNVNDSTQDLVAGTVQNFLADIPWDVAAHVLYCEGFRDPLIKNEKSNTMKLVFRECLKIVGENLPRFDDTSVRRIQAAYSKTEFYSSHVEAGLWAKAPKLTIREAMVLVDITRKKDSFSLTRAAQLKQTLLEHKDELANENFFTIVELAQRMALLAVQSPKLGGGLQELATIFAGVLDRVDAMKDYRNPMPDFLLSLAILGVYPERELDFLFSEEQQKTMMSSSGGVLSRFFLLERYLRTHFGDRCKYVVIPELSATEPKRRYPTVLDNELKCALQSALGGPQFVLERLMTPLGVEADFVVILDQNGNQIPLCDKEDALKDLPPNYKVVAILQGIDRRDFARFAPNTMRTPFALKQHFLRCENIYPLTIRMSDWKVLPPNEKVPSITRDLETAARMCPVYRLKGSMQSS